MAWVQLSRTSPATLIEPLGRGAAQGVVAHENSRFKAAFQQGRRISASSGGFRNYRYLQCPGLSLLASHASPSTMQAPPKEEAYMTVRKVGNADAVTRTRLPQRGVKFIDVDKRRRGCWLSNKIRGQWKKRRKKWRGGDGGAGQGPRAWFTGFRGQCCRGISPPLSLLRLAASEWQLKGGAKWSGSGASRSQQQKRAQAGIIRRYGTWSQRDAVEVPIHQPSISHQAWP